MAEITCPTDCSTELPVVSFDDCNPEARLSEITKIYIASPEAVSFTSVGSASEWAKRLSMTNAPPAVEGEEDPTPVKDLIRPLTVIGDRPAPTAVSVDISNGRTKQLRKDFVINFTIDEITEENLTFQRNTECNMKVKFWYEAGGLLFGGNDGIEGTIASDLVLERGTDSVMAINGTLTWKGKFTEEAVESPLS